MACTMAPESSGRHVRPAAPRLYPFAARISDVLGEYIGTAIPIDREPIRRECPVISVSATYSREVPEPVEIIAPK